ncbi:MAG: aromatic ring-hydroxylating dioxygenase subunit alpha [Rhodobacteraceae bacterium]|nr:aromatic ring-hydroxylating dioxygenase subunit alpha [Paracoccaceae bacterium]
MNEIAAQKPKISRASDTTLTRDYYVSPDVFEREVRQVFFKQWSYAGHVSQIPNIGDFFLHSYAGESLIIVRESAENIRAHFNVCRHRGSQLTEAPSGNVKRFVCPYHQWTYELDGRLKRAPMMPDAECIDYEKLSLHMAAVEVWAGMIFINLASQPEQTLIEALGAPPAGLLKLEPERLKEICRDRLLVKANWKTLLENYLECYHCAGSHPELGVAFDIQSSFDQTADWGGTCFLGGEPLRKGLVTVSMTGELVSKPLGRHAEDRTPELEVAEGLGLLPVLTRVLLHIDHAVIHVMNPLSVNEVEWTSYWYVRDDAVEGQDYSVDKVAEVWRATNAEDKQLCERNYKGVLSRTFVPGPLNPRAEGALRPVLDVYLRMMDQ